MLSPPLCEASTFPTFPATLSMVLERSLSSVDLISSVKSFSGDCICGFSFLRALSMSD